MQAIEEVIMQSLEHDGFFSHLPTHSLVFDDVIPTQDQAEFAVGDQVSMASIKLKSGARTVETKTRKNIFQNKFGKW